MKEKEAYQHLHNGQVLNSNLKDIAELAMCGRPIPLMALKIGRMGTGYFNLLWTIEDHLTSSFRLNHNPLPHMRRLFDSFKWQFKSVEGLEHEPDTCAREITHFINLSDFFWVVDQWVWIGATCKGVGEAPDSFPLVLPCSRETSFDSSTKGPCLWIKDHLDARIARAREVGLIQ